MNRIFSRVKSGRGEEKKSEWLKGKEQPKNEQHALVNLKSGHNFQCRTQSTYRLKRQNRKIKSQNIFCVNIYSQCCRILSDAKTKRKFKHAQRPVQVLEKSRKHCNTFHILASAVICCINQRKTRSSCTNKHIIPIIIYERNTPLFVSLLQRSCQSG